jgi:hypothetical protein
MVLAITCFARARAQHVTTFSTGDEPFAQYHHVFSSPLTEVQLSSCSVSGTMAWTKDGEYYVVTHAEIDAMMGSRVRSAQVVLFGFARADYGHPLVSSLVSLTHSADDSTVFNNEGPVAYTWGANSFGDFRWETAASVGNPSHARTFVCGVLRVVRLDGGVRTDPLILSLYHRTSYGHVSKKSPKAGARQI